MEKFTLSEEEERSLQAFKDKHKECRKRLTPATDGTYPLTYMFTPGGIGTIVKVKCNGCGLIEDITDINTW